MEEVSSTIFKIFGRTRLGIERRSPGPLANTLPIQPWNLYPNVGMDTNSDKTT